MITVGDGTDRHILLGKHLSTSAYFKHFFAHAFHDGLNFCFSCIFLLFRSKLILIPSVIYGLSIWHLFKLFFEMPECYLVGICTKIFA